jgi:uncharacterized membrane protein
MILANKALYLLNRHLLLGLLVWCVFVNTQAAAEALNDKNIVIKIEINGQNVIVDANLTVNATRRQVWDVLTDFEHMSQFISNLKESTVLERTADKVKIAQRGAANFGPVSFSFESTREIQLTPYDKIRSHMISGNLRKLEGMTQLVDEETQTRIVYHTDSIPGVWIPPLVGKIFIEHEVREQFQEMLDEIGRRKLAGK